MTIVQSITYRLNSISRNMHARLSTVIVSLGHSSCLFYHSFLLKTRQVENYRYKLIEFMGCNKCKDDRVCQNVKHIKLI